MTSGGSRFFILAKLLQPLYQFAWFACPCCTCPLAARKRKGETVHHVRTPDPNPACQACDLEGQECREGRKMRERTKDGRIGQAAGLCAVAQLRLGDVLLAAPVRLFKTQRAQVASPSSHAWSIGDAFYMERSW